MIDIFKCWSLTGYVYVSFVYGAIETGNTEAKITKPSTLDQAELHTEAYITVTDHLHFQDKLFLS
ncbi:UNVERIFIED_CONTAM: hypothetical protein FKN15_006149 [Acipenser sinensis]